MIFALNSSGSSVSDDDGTVFASKWMERLHRVYIAARRKTAQAATIDFAMNRVEEMLESSSSEP